MSDEPDTCIVDGDTFVRYTADNADAVSQLLEDHELCLAHERSVHTGNMIFATITHGAFGSHHYVRELAPGDWLRLCADGNIEEYTGEI